MLIITCVSTFHLHAVTEAEHERSVMADCHDVDDRKPQLIVKDRDRLVQFVQFKHKGADGVSLGLPFFLLRLKLLDLLSHSFVPLLIAVVLRRKLFLVLCRGRILLDALSREFHDDLGFPEQFLHLRIDCGGIRQSFIHHPAVRKDTVTARQKTVVGGQKPCFDVILDKVRRGADVFTLELIVALPDGASVFVRGVPGLGSEEPTAVFTDKPCTEHAVAAVLPLKAFSSSHLKLNKLPIFRRDDGFVGMLDVVLRHFTFVWLYLFLQKIDCERLLKQRRPLILLVGEDALDNRYTPFLLACRGWDTFLGERLGNRERGLALDEHGVNSADYFCLVFHDDKRMVFVRSFLIAEETAVCSFQFAQLIVPYRIKDSVFIEPP